MKKIISCLLALCMLYGCSTSNNASGKYTTGTYSASAKGFGGDVTVSVTTDTTTITDVVIDAPDETETVGGAALDDLKDQILKNQSSEIDGVSGATFTSDAVKKATENALAQAEGKETATTGELKPGTYTHANRGYGGDVTVATTIDETGIVSVEVTDSGNESVAIGGFAIKELPAKIVEAQSTGVDSISGASMTSAAIKKDVEQALEDANADLSKYTAKVTVAKQDDTTIDTDVVIVGSGGAGLTAALESLNNGEKVVILEKMDTPGGNTVRSSGAFNVAGSKEQVEANKGNVSVQEFIDYTIEGGHGINNKELVTYMVENSAPIVDWLREQGFDVQIGETYGGYDINGEYTPAANMILGFIDKIEEKGGEILYDTKATSIIMSDGKATGIEAERGDGSKVTVNAKAVILASGGFGGDMDLVTEYRPDYEGYVTDNNPGITGDGIKMAEAVGAATVDMDQIQAHPTIIQSTSTMVTEGARKQGGILLNINGERFVNECTFRDVVSAAILEQPEKTVFILFNQDIVDNNSNIAGYYKIGAITKCDDAQAIADYIGHDVTADTVQATLDKWAQAVADQNDPDFGSEFTWIRDLSTGPWYIAQVAPGIHHTMGGVEINANAEVIGTDGNVIPGLFAAGEVTGGIHGGNRIGGNAILDILVFGKTAADTASEYLK